MGNWGPVLPECYRTAGRVRTFSGHQNQRPKSAATDGVMNDRTTKVSNSYPIPMVVPTWPMTRSSLIAIELMVKANTPRLRNPD